MAGPNTIKLSTEKSAYRKYVDKHQLKVAENVVITIETDDTEEEDGKKGFHILIDNRDNFFSEVDGKPAKSFVNEEVHDKKKLTLKIKSGL